jgi:hypothetical protein
MTTLADIMAAHAADAFGPTVDTRTAADWLGVGYETLLDAVRDGTAPIRPISVGRVYRWPTLPLLAVLGIDG